MSVKMDRLGLGGLTVLSLEARRSSEIANLIERQGGRVLAAPSMEEVPFEENAQVLDFFKRFEAREIEVAIFLTGVGTQWLLESWSKQYSKERILAALSSTFLVVRGPKPLSVLRKWGLEPQVKVPEPNTWKELLETLDKTIDLTRKRVAIQEYGVSNPDLILGLQAREAQVFPLAIYRWELPKDLDPLKKGLRALVEGKVDVAMFTSAAQVRHVFLVAQSMKLEDLVRKALQEVVVASIGPVCSSGLRNAGIEPDLEPDHSKMGHLVVALAREAGPLIRSKREGRNPTFTTV